MSVVVPARDAAATIGACVAAVLAQRFPADRRELIVVDDGSRDGTAAVARDAGARVVSETGRGPAAARNAGARAASGDLLLFTDADCVPDPDWIARLVAPFRDPDVVATKGAYRTEQPQLVARFAQAEYEDKYRRMRHFPTIDFVDTYSAAYRRDAFLLAGGFDERYRQAANEDLDLSFRLAEQGSRMIFVPDALVRHTFPTRLRDYARRKYKVGYWKPLLHRDHPEKAKSDSHTPGTLRLQIVLAALAGALAVPGLVWRPAGWGLAAALIGHVASSLPMAVRSARADRRLLPAVPILVLVRSYALGIGYPAGWRALRRGSV